jgi:hypothetical protein
VTILFSRQLDPVIIVANVSRLLPITCFNDMSIACYGHVYVFFPFFKLGVLRETCRGKYL